MNLPYSNNLPIKFLSSVFNNTTNSYKFYWFYAIVESVRENSDPLIPINKLLAKMISNVWYPINYFKISFGKQDRLGNIALDVKLESQLSADSKQNEVMNEVFRILNNTSNIDILANLNSLIRYVPYRFLRPWFTNELRGLPDYKINLKIKELAELRFHDLRNRCIYRFINEEKKYIEFSKQWFDYIQKHNKILMDFCLWNLLKYLQKNNPNVPNIADKLFAPQTRNLSKAKNFWNLVFDEFQEFTCIYSQSLISRSDYSIDHFIPWRFITHDLLWNLIPVQKFINSAKSDSLPSLEKYFNKFAQVQYKAFKIVFRKNKMKMLEDYSNLYLNELKDIYKMSEEEFKNQLYSSIAPLVQIAENMGFEPNWTI